MGVLVRQMSTDETLSERGYGATQPTPTPAAVATDAVTRTLALPARLASGGVGRSALWGFGLNPGAPARSRIGMTYRNDLAVDWVVSVRMAAESPPGSVGEER